MNEYKIIYRLEKEKIAGFLTKWYLQNKRIVV